MLSALIQNFDTVEEAIEASAGSAGSALEENERYLDSIQGKIDQFTNATQSMWSNFLDADVVKWVIGLGTNLIKIVDTVGLIPSILAAILTYKIAIGAAKMFDLGSLGTYISMLFTANSATEVQGLLINKTALAQKLMNSTLIQAQAARMGLTAADLAGYSVTQLLTLGIKGLAAGFKNLWVAMGPVGWAILGIIAALTAGIAIFNAVYKTSEELEEELSNLQSEVSDMKSELESLNSELETTQDRMEELLSKDSLSFVEEEELKNLQLQNELLEKKIQLQEMLLKNKVKETNKAAEDVVNDSWNGTRLDKKYAISTYDLSSRAGGAAIIKKDDLWSSGVSGKEALDTSIASYIARKKQADIEDSLYLKVLEEMDANDGSLSDELISRIEDELSYEQGFFEDQHGYVTTDGFYDEVASAKNIAEHVKSALEGSREVNSEALRMQEEGIEMVLGDLLKQIPEDYEYGSSDVIDQAFDELTAYRLKYENAQGISSKSDIINTMFGAGASEEMQKLEEELRDIAESEDDVAKKAKDAEAIIQKAYDSDDDGYKRLKNSIDIVDISVEELAKSFIALSEATNLGTIGGVLKVFSGGEEILSNFKNGIKDIQLGVDEAGESITWDNLFTEEDGERVVNNLKVSAILKGADEGVREQFTKLIEEVENGKMGVDEALSRWKMVGADKAVDALNTEFEALNSELFPDATDEISGLIDTLSELKSAFESVANTMDTFKGAQEEYNETGRVSIKTALELMSSTDDWDKVLNITEDSITLVDGAEKALMDSQLKSIAEQMQTAADMAKIKLDAAENAQAAKQAFDAEANAVNNLSNAEQNVNNTQQAANATTQQRTGALGELANQTYTTAISELDYAGNDGVVQTAESVKAKAIGLVSAAIVGLDAFIDALLTDKTMKEAWSEYQEARKVVTDDANGKTTTVDQLRKDYEKKQAMANVAKNGDTYGEFGTNWDGNDDEQKEAEDAFQKEMDYWENRIGANQAKYEQIQNEIDLLESKGQKANAAYYQEQISLENQRMHLLQGQKRAAKEYLATFEEGSDEWWEVANTLNDIEGEIDSVTASIVDLQDAIGEINVYKFDEFNKRLDNMTSKLGTIRDLIAPDGEEDWFDDNGDWTESGVAVLGTYIQELETYKQGYQNTMDELAKYEPDYEGNEGWYSTLGIHSEQEYYDKVEELTDQQYSYAESISDTEQSVVDMYESSIDAVEEYTQTLVDGYNDYIDSVKEALDAERDLYDFKKNVQKQAKDIAEIERRIMSLSGSTNAADIAERRRLEADLYGAREELDNTYYDHAKDTQQNALDSEAEAYEENMTKFVEGLRLSLEEATLNMDEFLMGVTSMVMYNADTVLTKYQETNLPLTTELTNPWERAKEAVGNYSGNALALMNEWTKQGGFFEQFNATGTVNLQSPWNSGTLAATAFKTSVSNVMSSVVSNISSNVQSASGELSRLYQQIKDTEERAASAKVAVSSGGSGSGGGGGSGTVGASQSTPTTASVDNRILNKYKLTSSQVLDLGYGPISLEEFERLLKNYQIKYSAIYKQVANTREIERGSKRVMYGEYVSGPFAVRKYAKGTLGTKRDEWAITDELGPELKMYATPEGNLSFMAVGSTVVPADLTKDIMEIADLGVEGLVNTPKFNSGVNVITNAVNKPELNLSFDSLVHVDHCDEGTLKNLEKMVDNKINDFSKQLNYSIKRFTR